MLPTKHILRAALLVARTVDAWGTTVTSAQKSYQHLPTNGLFRATDLVAGERLLVRCGLLQRIGEDLIPADGLQDLEELEEEEAIRALVTTLLAIEAPLWLHVATASGDVDEEFIPEHELERLADLLPNPDQREAALLAAAQTFDPAALSKLGDLGEQAVVAAYRAELERLGRPELRGAVRQVSRVSALLGYDVVTPTLQGKALRIEVKTIGSPGPMCRFFISRNEAEVGSRDPSWRLVVCERGQDGKIGILGWCMIDAIERLLPTDPIGSIRGTGRWSSVRIQVPRDLLSAGLPPIR